MRVLGWLLNGVLIAAYVLLFVGIVLGVMLVEWWLEFFRRRTKYRKAKQMIDHAYRDTALTV